MLFTCWISSSLLPSNSDSGLCSSDDRNSVSIRTLFTGVLLPLSVRFVLHFRSDPSLSFYTLRACSVPTVLALSSISTITHSRELLSSSFLSASIHHSLESSRVSFSPEGSWSLHLVLRAILVSFQRTGLVSGGSTMIAWKCMWVSSVVFNDEFALSSSRIKQIELDMVRSDGLVSSLFQLCGIFVTYYLIFGSQGSVVAVLVICDTTPSTNNPIPKSR